MSKLERTNISGGVPWEPLRGYSRAVRVGDTLYISGTTSTDKDGSVFAPGDAYEQTKYVIRKILRILDEAGFKQQDVVRTRLFVTDISQWERYARAHREFFEKVRPASGIVQVSKLTDPRLVVEIEATAVRGTEMLDPVSIDL